ncbi:centrosome-associated protein CEP250 isoform X2 [Rhodamnia argentea]|uniref:FRIGIDA-like protein n=1 Tax=Rhodamnia argentea TaxID=178133 RepID=A0A8B8NEY3_9MYRT|nr:centrosome-associated protein CEP250 isoform X2 [Rhodamnia argentea]
MVKSTSEELIRVQSLLDHSVKAHDDSERRLSILERTIKKRDKEVMLKAGKLQSIENRLNSCEVELKVKEEELKGFHKSMDERSKELESKESELLSVDILIEEHKEALKSKQEELEETNKFINERLAAVALKDRELGSIQTSIGKLSKNLKSKEGEMENMMKRVKQCNEEAESKKEDIAAVQAKLEEVAKSLEWKSKELNAVQASIKDRNLELASKRRWLESIQIDITKRAEQLRLKEKEYAFIQSSTLECSKALEFKKKQCYLMHNSITKCSQELESKKGQLDAIQKRSRECLTELKEKHLHMLNQSIGECSRILEMKKRERNVQCMELELGRQWLDLIEKLLERRSREMELRERTSVHSRVVAQIWRHPLINGPVLASCQNCQSTNEIHDLVNSVSQLQIAQEMHQVLGPSAVAPGSSGSIQQWQIKIEEPENFDVLNADDSCVEYPSPSTILASHDLQLYQTELSNENTMTCKEISHMLQNSSDPAKLVLDVIAGSCAQYSNSEDMNLQTDVRSSHIVLLEQLVRILPSITHDVKEEAMKLAREWKAKLSDKPESALEVSAFQHFLAAYNLCSLFDDAPLLGQTLGLVDEITAPGSTPASLSRVHQQPPREKKRPASDRATDLQSQFCARKCKSKMNNQGGPL